mgnify:CR=1 FL=1
MDQKARMQELVKRLNETAHAYYVLGEPVISDMQWDAMYDELKAAPTAPGFREIMIPGEIEFHLTRQAEREGIDISPAIEQDFADLAVRYGVPLELLQSC